MRITRQMRERIIAKSKDRCSICGKSRVPLEIDHILPISQGGTNSLDNLRVVCRSCHVLADKTSPQDIRVLQETQSRGYQMEQIVSKLFAEQGYAVLVGATGLDGDADLIVRGMDSISDRPTTIIVQCKWTQQKLREETVARVAAYKEASRADHALLVSNQNPTTQVMKKAEELGVSIVLSDHLTDFVAAFARRYRDE